MSFDPKKYEANIDVMHAWCDVSIHGPNFDEVWKLVTWLEKSHKPLLCECTDADLREEHHRRFTTPPAPSQRITFSVPLTPQTHTSGHVPLMQSALSPEQFNEYVGTIQVK